MLYEVITDEVADRGVDLAAEVPGGNAQSGADDARDQRRERADEERDARTVDQAREVVAAELVGAEA